MAWTTTELLADIRLQAKLVATDPDYTDAVLLRKADFSIATRFVPTILKLRENYYARYYTSSIVANQQAYAFPSRAYGATLREVVYVGTTADDTYQLQELQYTDRLGYEGETGVRPDGYIVEDDRILLLPKPSTTSGSIRFCYEYRPGVLVATTAAMAITGITGIATGEITGVPVVGWLTSYLYDIIKATPPFALVSSDLVCTEVHASTHITFSSTLDTSRIAIGDYVCKANESCIPQVPAELHGALAMAVAAEVMAEAGDSEGAALAEPKVQAMIEQFKITVARRVKSPIKRMVNRRSPLRCRIGGVSGMGHDDGTP